MWPKTWYSTIFLYLSINSLYLVWYPFITCLKPSDILKQRNWLTVIWLIIHILKDDDYNDNDDNDDDEFFFWFRNRKKAKRYFGIRKLQITSWEVMIFQEVDRRIPFCVSKTIKTRNNITSLQPSNSNFF